jgi:cardiolipin synthase
VVQDDLYPILPHHRRHIAAARAQTHALLDEMQAAGIQLKRTAPPGRFGMYMLYRDHKKMIILDKETAFVGGINISDHNYAWHDFMVKITDGVVTDLVTDFCSTWNGQTQPFDRIQPDGDFILNQCTGRYPIFEAIYRMINEAQRRVVIESPYVLGDGMESVLLAAAKRGVAVQVIIPHPNNKGIFDLWHRTLRYRLNHPNVTVYGYPGMTHAKMCMVDDRQVTFGSLNMFEIEGATQKELNVFSDDPLLVEQFIRFIEQDIKVSTLLHTPRNAPGRFTYTLAHGFIQRWNRRLLRNPNWKATYC